MMRVSANKVCKLSLVILGLSTVNTASAGEDLFGYVKGAEALPKDAIELYQKLTFRDGSCLIWTV